LTLRHRARERLLDVDGLARGCRHCDVVLMAGWRCGDVDGVHVVSVHHLVRVRGPTGHAVALRVVTGPLAIAAHHDGDRAAGDLPERRTGLDLCDVARAYESPPDTSRRLQVFEAHRHHFRACRTR